MRNLIKSVVTLFFVTFGSYVFSQSEGTVHNELVNAYFETYGENPSMENPYELTAQVYEVGLNLYPERFGGVSLEKLIEDSHLLYGESGLSEFNFTSGMLNLLDKMVRDGKISSQFRTVLADIINNNSDVQTAKSMINEYIATGQAREDDIKAGNVAIDIMENSLDLWSKKRKCSANAQVIFADTVVGALFSVLSGPGGVLAGGAASLAVNHGQEQNGGGCW